MPSQPNGTNGDADTEMRDASSGANGNEVPLVEDETLPRDTELRIRVLPGDTRTAASFEFTNEDHTLGNALRYIIMKNPNVEFCGYSIPHPSDPKMNLRIQTYDDEDVYDVLEKGLQDLMELCDVVTEKFTIARDNFPKSADP